LRYQFVDCRWELGNPGRGRELYLEGHVPGASFLDVEGELSAPPASPGGRHPLPSADAFAKAAGRAGIGPGVFVVAYDQGMDGGAARLWWVLRHFGHEDVAVLAGGLDSWAGPLRSGAEEIEPAVFTPSPRSGDTIEADELSRRLGEGGLVVLDARAPERYRGEVEPIDPVAGHIPGAKNLPYTGAADIPPELLDADEIVVYCGSGITACVDLLALARGGRPDAKLYPGSWSDWSGRGLPVERG
jgi:thiosulfate/3-mercaptopyruvate sulfurtransferase